jgi:hypothetical protein
MKDKSPAIFSFGTFEMTLITLVLIGLKLTMSPDLPWPVVLAPLWIPAALVLVILAVPIVIIALTFIACVIVGGACIVWDFVTGIWNGGAK